MAKSRIKKIIFGVIIFITYVALIHVDSNAAGFTVSAGSTSLNPDKTTSFQVTGQDCEGKFRVTTSDASVVEIVVQDPSKEVNNMRDVWVNGTEGVTLKAKKAGKATITATTVDVSNTAGTEEVKGSKSVIIEVKEPAKAPDTSSAKLKSITVAGKTYNNPSQDMTVNVGADVGETTISAVANDGNAKISGTGNKQLAAGINVVVLTVTGSNGATLKYTVRIKKAAKTAEAPNITGANEPTPEPTPEENQAPELLRLSYLLVDDAELMPEFDAETFEYRISVINADSVNVAANANDENASIEIKGDKDLIEGDNEVTITLTRGEGEEKEETIYTIIVTKAR